MPVLCSVQNYIIIHNAELQRFTSPAPPELFVTSLQVSLWLVWLCAAVKMILGANSTCNGNISRPSCYLSPTEVRNFITNDAGLAAHALCLSAQYGELDAVAAIRMVMSCLR